MTNDTTTTTTKDFSMSGFYSRLIEEMKKNGLRKCDVADYINVTRGTLSNWRNGGTPSTEALVKLAALFKVSTTYLLYGKTDPSISDSLVINGLTDIQRNMVEQFVDLLKNMQKLTPEAYELGYKWQMLPKEKKFMIEALVDDMINTEKIVVTK